MLVQNWTQKNPNLTFMVVSAMMAMVETKTALTFFKKIYIKNK
jgi:hypothetical protein